MRNRLAAAALLCVLLLAGVIVTQGSLARKIHKPTSGVHSGRPRLVLAVEQMGLGVVLDPLWVGWPQDRSALAKIQAAFRSAQHVRYFAHPPWSRYYDWLYLWFSDGTEVMVQPYQSSGSELLVTLGQGRTQLVESASLFSIERTHQAFTTPEPTLTTPVPVTASGIVTVRGGGAVGSSVIIFIAPNYSAEVGMVMPAGAFPVGTARVDGGEYDWQGKVGLPAHYRVYRPMNGWQVAVQVVPFKGLSQAVFQLTTRTLPVGVRPLLPPSRVATPSDALAAVRSSPVHVGLGFPIWLQRPGSRSVSWLNYEDLRESGIEATTVTQQGSTYRVVVRLAYGRAERHYAYREAWLVSRNGQVTLLLRSGRRPEIGQLLPAG